MNGDVQGEKEYWEKKQMLTKCITHTILKHVLGRGKGEQYKPDSAVEHTNVNLELLLWRGNQGGCSRPMNMSNLRQRHSVCNGEYEQAEKWMSWRTTTVTAVDGLIWVCNGYGDAAGNICTMWGCFYFLEHFLRIPIVIPPRLCN